MAICPACHRENQDVDFCEACGHYLRWESTRSRVPVGREAAELGRRPEPAAQLAAVPDVAPPPAPPPSAPPPPAPHEPVLVVLRLPGAGPAAEGTPIVRVEPGAQASVLALVRNQTGIVDAFDVAVEGIPEGWCTIAPSAVNLLPFGVGEDGYEREVEITFAVPRSSEAEARDWPFRVTAVSHTDGRVARASGRLSVAPFAELEAEMRPQRKRGRLRARFAIAARNHGNADARIAFDAHDDGDACRFRFAAPEVEAPPGRRAGSVFWVRPHRQIWIGRPVEHRFTAGAQLAGSDRAAWPQQGVFVQKPWLPRWLLVAVPILAVAAVAAYLLWPRTVVVPDLRGARTPFEAAERLAERGLVLGGRTETLGPPGQAGRILAQSPPAGSEVEEGTEVSYEWSVAADVERVPQLTGRSLEDAVGLLHERKLELGRAMPLAEGPRDRITGQVPRAGELVRSGSPVDVFLEGATPVDQRVQPASSPGDDESVRPGTRPTHVAPQLPDLLLDSAGDLWLVKEAVGEPFNLTATKDLVEEEPAFAPGGRLVAFRRGTASKGRIVVLDVTTDGADALPVTARGDRDHTRPAFAPDGRVIALVSSPPDPTGGSDSDLCFAPASPAEPARPRCIVDPATDVSRPAWAPDGRRILVVWNEFDGRTRLGMYTSDRASAGDPRAWAQLLPLTEGLDADDGEGSVFHAAWSPKGKRVAFTASWNTGEPHVFVATLQRNGVALAPDKIRELRGIRACEVAWTGDGRRLAVVARDDDPDLAGPCDGAGVVWTLDPDRPGSLHAVTDYARARNPAWRPVPPER